MSERTPISRTRGRSLAQVPVVWILLALGACGPRGEERLDADRDSSSRDELSTVPGPGSEPGSPAGGSDTRPTEAPRPVVLFLGNSLTAGLGVDLLEAFPALIQERIDASGLGLRVVNAGVSGETSAGGLSRIDWILEQDLSVLVLALGANDALRGAPPEAVASNLQAIIDRTRARHPEARIVLVGMLAPPNMGRAYTTEFEAIFPRLAQENGVELIPFLLEGVAAHPGLNQADGIHPTADGHQIMARTVWRVLEPVLREGPSPARLPGTTARSPSRRT